MVKNVAVLDFEENLGEREFWIEAKEDLNNRYLTNIIIQSIKICIPLSRNNQISLFSYL
jgi:hypothetical protein